ncbi:hypothetical protein ES288_A08G211800v1 [Gossypium darwinii]|uniref:Uncharacterized protein n=1 Tax=Gossypium darwinii TaxID=34276 RepID=A0A5D2FM00_GOSDA|nr:hypothetical protein ES288_A08G211800v1 [Gossypium darwinii]
MAIEPSKSDENKNNNKENNPSPNLYVSEMCGLSSVMGRWDGVRWWQQVQRLNIGLGFLLFLILFGLGLVWFRLKLGRAIWAFYIDHF